MDKLGRTRAGAQLDIVLTCGEQPAETLIISGPLHLWATLLDALGPGHDLPTIPVPSIQPPGAEGAV